MSKRLILASGSPRRRELLSLLRLPFDVMVSDEDEDIAGTPAGVATILAERKAESIALGVLGVQGIVLGADTVVAADFHGDTIQLAKPSNEDDARRMLRILSGRTHTVITGIALTEIFDQEARESYHTHSRVVDTQVTFRELTDEMIDAYIDTGEPFDKAGAYGIQGYASAFVTAIYGDYFNIVGLPVATVAQMLEEIGIEWWRGAAALE